MNVDFADRVTQHPPTSVPARMGRSLWRQAGRSALCPDNPRLDGQIALVTGGSRGIGLETSRGLAERGAEVISASRDEETGKQGAEAIRAAFDVPAHFVPLDLGNLDQMPRTLDRLEAVLRGRPLDVLVANAGLLPHRHALSARGHEIAFATNVLGHHALIRVALDRDLLAKRARIVVVTGDIYVMASDCSADYAYRGMLEIALSSVSRIPRQTLPSFVLWS
jgi:NAD(P)-dependent dehydrogenase (short-subunit alcohol dehydrogenase family)